MGYECPKCFQDSLYWDSFGPRGGEYVCGNCGYTMRDDSWDQTIEDDPELQESVNAIDNAKAKLMDELYNNEDPIEKIKKNIPK
jgi:transcription initiation factor TFIIIB Brf1 subunit/transcription initiation factor TFIIB